ncbi:MAG: dephospho-CoA kinase [Candidatus Omnitrophota bacterium]|jgi:dephospho-CoA kinase
MVLGITGVLGSGKSTVARIFKSLARGRGELLDADAIARRLMTKGSSVYRRIVAAFGGRIIGKNGAIERPKLAALVFDNPLLLRRLNRIIHPEVIGVMKNQIKSSRAKLLILDVPLLLEAGMEDMVDKIIVVKIKRREQIRRLAGARGFNRKEILERMNSQMPQGEKIRLADFVIDNSNKIEETRTQAVKIWRSLWKN